MVPWFHFICILMECLCHDFIDLITDWFFFVLNLFIYIFFLFLFLVFLRFRYTWYKQTLYIRHGLKQKPTTFLLGDLPIIAKKVYVLRTCNNLNKSKMLQRIFPYVIYIQCAIMAKWCFDYVTLTSLWHQNYYGNISMTPWQRLSSYAYCNCYLW